MKDQSLGFDGDYFNLVEPSMVTETTADKTVDKSLDKSVNKPTISGLKDLKPASPKVDQGPLTPVDSPRTAIEKIIQGKSKSPNKDGGVARS